MNKTKEYNNIAWLMWGLAAGFFFIHYVARVSLSVMGPEIMRDFSVGAYAFGGLSVYFYYAYVGMQIPVGMLIDRFGIKLLLTLAVLSAAAGCFLFGIAPNLYYAKTGRLLLGLGSAFGFVGAIKLAAFWFPRRMFGMLAGSTQALGMLGAAVAALPVGFLVARVDWRNTMLLIGGVLFILAVLIFFIVRDKPSSENGVEQKSEIEEKQQNIERVSFSESFLTVLKNPQTWFNGVFVGMLYASATVFGELWGVQYLRRVYDVSGDEAGLAISVIFIGWTTGSPLVGWLSDKIGRRRPFMFLSAFLSLLMMSIVLYMPAMSISFVIVFLFAFGVVNSGVSISYAVSGEINPLPVAGTSVAFANMASVLIGAVLQKIIGKLLELNWDGKYVNGLPFYDSGDFRMAMIVIPVTLIIAMIFSFLVKETYCRNVSDEVS